VGLRRLLAVTHTASLTGAPMNLLHLVRWIREHTDIEVHTLVLEPGPLVSRFEQCGKVTVIRGVNPFSLLAFSDSRRLAPLTRQLMWAVHSRRIAPQLRHLHGFDLMYLNSTGSLAVHPLLPAATAVVSHVHELDVALRTMPQRAQRLLCKAPDTWIAAAQPIHRLLVGELDLPADRVLLCDEFIAAVELTERATSLRDIEACRRELQLPTESPIVLGAGTLCWRKGPDLFIQLATEVRRRTRRPVRFVWLGGLHDGLDWERVRSDRDRAGADHVHFVAERADPTPWFAAADVFALTSREDPLPLVGLESAALGLPIVTYRNGGLAGMLEAAGPDAAAGVVDHLDVGTMAARVLDLLEADGRRRASIEQARARVLAHHDVGVAAPRLVAGLEAIYAAKLRPSGGRLRETVQRLLAPVPD
jgi:glycosyltransferase involved in cell wall biosynthesis